MDEHASGGRPAGGRSTWLLAGVVAIVVVCVAAASVVLLQQRQDAAYPAGSAEAAFQAYVRAWDAGDADLAWESLSTAAQERSSLERFRSANRRRPDEVHRVWIDDVSREGDRTILYLGIESLTDDGLLGPSRERAGARMSLVLEDDDWKIDSPTVVYYW